MSGTKLEFYLAKIKNELPKLKWKSFQFFSHGYDHDVVVLDANTVFRFPKSKEYARALQNEARLLDFIAPRISIGIPRYTHLFRDGSAGMYPLLVGQELTTSLLRELSDATRGKIAQQLADFMTALHGTSRIVVQKFRVNEIDRKNKLFQLIRDTKKYVFPRLTADEIKRVEAFFAQCKKTLAHPFASGLVHADLGTDHILWDKVANRISVIDFSDREFGDPALDFAGLLSYGEKFTKQVFEIYKGKKDAFLLARAQLYYQMVPLHTMKAALTGTVCNYTEAYKAFTQRFLS